MGDLMKDDNKTKKQLVDELTELRLQNAALKESESAEKYRSLVENIRDVIYELDSQGVVLYISPAVRDMLGFDSAEIVGKSFIDLAYKDDHNLMTEWFSELSKGTEKPSDCRVLNKSGELRWAQTKTRPVIEDGVFKGARGILIDVTAQRRAEETLRKSEEKYRWVLNNMADVITVMDMNLRFTYVSPSIMRMRGYTPEEALAQTFEQVMTPESLKISAEVFEEEMTLEAGGTADPDRIRTVEVEQYRKDGSIVLMENHLSFLRDEAKKPVGIISVSHDITHRKRSENHIRRQTDAIEAAIDGIALLNEDGEYVYLNQAHVRIYGYENAEELVGKSWRILYDADELQRLDEEVIPKIHQEGYWQGEALGMKKDGSKFPQGLSLTALHGGGLICVVRDITERKQAEVELQRTLDSLRKAVGTTIQVMVSAVEARDPYTAGHQIRVANLARAIATEMGLPQEKIEGIRMAGSIHDIGKLSIPAEILSKPTKLTNLEFSLIKEHSLKGYEMLKDVESPWPLAQIVYQHHERMDGSGYPRNLKGYEIIMEARILAVADVVEAMASYRPYRPAIGVEAALNEIEKNKGTLYDADAVNACLRLFQEKGFQLEGAR
jgi:PAS domain S-box-containing protein/putative nucleotidyltransferase with HDIG domain